MIFKPKIIDTLKQYDREQFVKDLWAGVVVGIVALPLAIAFSIASGLSLEKGLYTAVIAGFIISALGGSRVQIGGPTGTRLPPDRKSTRLNSSHGYISYAVFCLKKKKKKNKQQHTKNEIDIDINTTLRL